MPYLPTVKAMAPKAPMGAKRMRIFTTPKTAWVTASMKVMRLLPRSPREESAKPNAHAYQPYKGSPILRTAISNWYKTWYKTDLNPDTEILPLIGSKEGIMHICMTYLNEGDEVLIPNPGYPTYSSAVKLAGGTIKAYQLTAANNWQPDFDALDKMDLSRVKLLFVNYPHMPTGQLPTTAFFTKLVQWAGAKNILIVHLTFKSHS